MNNLTQREIDVLLHKLTGNTFETKVNDMYSTAQSKADAIVDFYTK
jgi:hypothetical protein